MERLTLEEAIAHAKEVAEKNYRGVDFESIDSIDDDIKANCLKCAEEHYKKKMLAFKLESKIYENKYNELLNLLRKVNSELSEDEFYEKLNVLLKKTRNK